MGCGLPVSGQPLAVPGAHHRLVAGRDEAVQNLKNEIKVVESYLPEQLSEDEVKTIVQETIDQVGATSKADFGKVMGAVMPKLKGKADGKLVNATVKELLN